jgi:ABC-type polysaccharide/polyol phosphate transport system ATPase subunit
VKAIEVEDLWESYWARRAAGGRSLKAAVGTLGKSVGIRKWALKGVSFSINAGEMLGVIGINGSGKTTLLRCLAGIYRPSKGTVTVRGRVSSLIDLTAGFQMDLSAYDNVLLAGSIYGMARQELIAKMDDVLSFAELPDHREASLRTFSTGMAMRLGFALAISLEPDILLVDEVLAVGDEHFKVKCLEKVKEMRGAGTTIVFASHELALVRSLCDRVVVLDAGELVFDGKSEGAVSHYCRSIGVDESQISELPPIEEATLKKIERAWARRQ